MERHFDRVIVATEGGFLDYRPIRWYRTPSWDSLVGNYLANVVEERRSKVVVFAIKPKFISSAIMDVDGNRKSVGSVSMPRPVLRDSIFFSLGFAANLIPCYYMCR